MNEENIKGKTFAEIFESQISGALEDVKARKTIKGKIIKIDQDFAHVDVNYKSVGLVPKEQFNNLDGEFTAKVGDEIDVYVLALENDHNQIVLSHERANQIRIWKEVEDKFKNGGIITGRVQHKVKGGLQVDIGIPAFLPGSQVDLKPHKNLDKFTGKTFDFKVLKITKDKGNIVVSRRALLVSEREELRSETLKVLQEGVVMEGTVKNITDYGAFIDLGGMDGLLHITDICWGHIEHPSDKLSVGQKLAVVVLTYDQDKERVSLGVKQLTEDPWAQIIQRYPVGTKITGPITALVDFGVFVKLEDGVDGLIHRSELGLAKNENIEDTYKVGNDIECEVVSVDPSEHQIGLSIRAIKRRERRDAISSFNDEIAAPTFGDLIKEKMDN